ncbi:hypothetical protein MARINOS108_90172 [Marinoscillum sp. 108]|nr:hypothetical protein MARINOS108_90172 [Marinoscillum sp. 108]
MINLFKPKLLTSVKVNFSSTDEQIFQSITGIRHYSIVNPTSGNEYVPHVRDKSFLEETFKIRRFALPVQSKPLNIRSTSFDTLWWSSEYINTASVKSHHIVVGNLSRTATDLDNTHMMCLKKLIINKLDSTILFAV